VRPDPFEELVLRAYPNPERKGCPGSETIRALADKLLPHGHPVWEHVWKCSPCFAEFRELRDARRERERLDRRRRAVYFAVVAAILLLAAGAAVTLLLSKRSTAPYGPKTAKAPASSQPIYPAAVLNLGISSTRSADENARSAQQAPVQRLPHRRVDLTVYLPRGSEDGEYQLEVLDSQSAVLISTSGKAAIDRGLTSFTTSLDLQKMAPGKYIVRSRRIPNGTWHVSPVIIEQQ
jgi:hypothetical protein